MFSSNTSRRFSSAPIRRFLAFTLLMLLVVYGISSLTSCFPSDPVLDMSGDLITVDKVIGTGATIALDSTVVTQCDVVLSERLTDGTYTISTSATKILVDNFSILAGLDKGMRGMRVGGQRTITIPPRFAYGNKKSGNVPANATVIYDVQLNKTELFQIQDSIIGTGDTAKVNTTVNVTYVGRLLNGNIFDATVAGSTFPFRIGAGSVIRGWDVGVLGMRVNGRRRLIIPSLLGYKDVQNGKIPPNSTLVFDITLVSVSQ